MSTESIVSTSFYSLFWITIVVKVTLLILNIKYIKSRLSEVPKQFASKIDLDSHTKAGHYTITKNKFSIFLILLHAAILICWLHFGLLNTLSLYLSAILNLNPILNGVLLFLIFNIINALIGLPESLYSTFVIEEKFGFNKMTFKLFIIDLIKQFILSITIMAPLLYGVFYLMYKSGEMWWFYTWIGIIIFQIIMIWAYPKFIAPLFNKFSTLDNEELAAKIKLLSNSTQINFKDYYIMNASIRSSHGNAYFTGFGPNKRIVFFDTLIKTLTSNEVIAVLAHELGHLKKKHIVKSIFMSAIALLIGLWILGQVYQMEGLFSAFHIQDQSAYMAVLIFMLITPYYTYLLTPIFSWLSRRNEYEADEFAAKHSSASELISALLKMYKDNSSTLTPHPIYSKFYFSHPPAAERVAFLERLIK